MNIFTEVLVACVILSCVALGLYLQYKEDNLSLTILTQQG